MLKLLGALAIALAVTHASAQTDTSAKSLSLYVYVVDSTGNKVLLSTQFSRDDPKYDDRAFHRFLDVLAGLEKRGFHKSEKAAIEDWDRPATFARCYIYMEDAQAGKKTKGGTVTGSRTYCTDNGVSEFELSPSESPKHVDQLLERFDAYLARAKKNLHK